jgi:hypothetical protein
MTERDNETRERGFLERLPQPWARSHAVIPSRVVRPLERFLHLEAGSASLLMAAAVVALLWVNVDAASYERVWDTRVDLDVGPSSCTRTCDTSSTTC